MHNPTSLVINWHLTEACNYHYQYCYDTCTTSGCQYELIRDPGQTAALFNELYQFLQQGYHINPLANRQDWSSMLPNLAKARQSNLGLRIKLNTVVNLLNHGEDLNSIFQRLSPETCKVLRIVRVVNERVVVSDEPFTAFIARYQDFDRILCPENSTDIRMSYLMIDLRVRLFENSPLSGEQAMPTIGQFFRQKQKRPSLKCSLAMSASARAISRSTRR